MNVHNTSSKAVYRLGYGMDELGSVPGRGSDGVLSPCHCVQTGSGTHPASYSMDTVSKEAGV